MSRKKKNSYTARSFAFDVFIMSITLGFWTWIFVREMRR